MASQIHGPEFEHAPGDGEGQGGLVRCSPWGRKESDTTEQLDNESMSMKYLSIYLDLLYLRVLYFACIRVLYFSAGSCTCFV